jgi:phenylacetate-CoA ligase
VLVQDRLWVELLNDQGQPAPAGERGEITVTGGFNFCLPLLRYRTGDHASLAMIKGEAVLMDLVGRAPVWFRDAHGKARNNIEITHALKHIPIAQYALHQAADEAFTLSLSAGSLHHGQEAATAIKTLFGAIKLTITALPEDAKARQYSSDLAGVR